MAKEHTDRASRAGVEEAAAASNQHNTAELLKKMKELAAADDAHAAQTSTSEASSADQVAAADAPAAQTAAADGIFASDAASADVVADAGTVSNYASEASGGVSTGTLLAIGGVALVGGGIAIAANHDGGGHGHKAKVDSVTPASASVDEGQTINFTVTGKPGATFAWSVDAAHAGDVTPASGSVTLDNNGNGVITLNTVADSTTEGAETLTLTVGGVDGTVTINDTSAQPTASNEDLTILTDGAPTFDFSDTTGANIVSGVAAGGNPFTETFSVGDHIIGNGETVLSLKVADGGNEAAVSLEHLGAINLVNAAGGTGATFNAVLWQDIGSINLVDGADGLAAGFTNLHTGVDMTIATGVAGSLGASLTNDVQVGLGAGKVSDIGWVDNNVDAHIANSETGGFFMGYTAPAALDLTLGDVNATVGKTADFQVTVFDQGGDGAVTAGNVTVGAGLNSDVTVGVGAGGTLGSHSVTVGDVDLSSAGGPSATAQVGVGVQEAAPGDVTVGNVTVDGFHDVSLGIGRSATSAAAPAGDVNVGDVAVSITKSGSLANAPTIGSIGNVGQNSASVGDLTVGNIDLSFAQNATGNTFEVGNYISLTGTASASAGNVAVGNLSVTVDTGAQSEVEIRNEVTTNTGTGSATIGDITVGNVTLNAAVNADVSVDVYASGYSAGDGTVGNVAVGDVSMTLNDGAHGDFNAAAYAGSTAGDAGNVTVGNISIDAANGVSASAELYISATANNGDVGNVTVGNIDASIGVSGHLNGGYAVYADANNVGDVTVGNIDVSLLDKGTASLGVYASAATGNVGDVSIGAISVSAAASATFDNDVFVHAANGNGTIGDISIGDVSLNASATGAVVNQSVDVSAATDVGTITLGNVTLVAATSASASLTANVIAGANMGDVAIGNVSVTASGTSAAAGVSMHYSASSDVGDVTLGDLSLVATGSGAVADYSLAATGFEVGDVTLGDVSVAVGVTSGAAGSATANLNIVTVGNLGGSIVAGDIDITLAAATTAAGNANFNFSVSSAHGDITLGDIALNVNTGTGGAFNNIGGSVSAAVGDISTGVISVSGGDGSQDALGNFANVLSVFHAVNGDIHVDGVDYSGYGAGVTLDAGVAVDDADTVASGFGTIIGSGFDDVITDNNGTNVITGGAGSDEFHFVATNHGLTADTADQITDWSHAADKIVLDGFGAVNTGNYTELSGSYTDVASFLAAANASSAAGAHAGANDVTVGVVDGTVYVAVDQGGLNDNAEYLIALTGTSNLNDIDVNNFTP